MKNKKKGSPKKLWKFDARVDGMISVIEAMIAEYEAMHDESIYPNKNELETNCFEYHIFKNAVELIHFCQARPKEYNKETLAKAINGLFNRLDKARHMKTADISEDIRVDVIDNPYDFYEYNAVMIHKFMYDENYSGYKVVALKAILNDMVRRYNYPKVYVKDGPSYFVRFVETGDCIFTVPNNARKLWSDSQGYFRRFHNNHPDDDYKLEMTHLSPDVIYKTENGGLYHVKYLLKSLCSQPDAVEEIGMMIYRFGSNNPFVDYIITALNLGIKVKLFIELEARDEIMNDLHILAKIKANVSHEKIEEYLTLSLEYNNVKVHGKMIYIDMKKTEESDPYTISIISTGNFNFDTTESYKDYIVVSSRKSTAKMVHLSFDTLFNSIQPIHSSISSLILNEIYKQIALGKKGRIWLQCNHLDNELIVKALKEAEHRGCDVKLIVRSTKGFHRNDIKHCKTVVGDKLEHARVYIFGKDSNQRVYLSSSDLMYRNLFSRFETYLSIDNINGQVMLINRFNHLWKYGQRPILPTIDKKKKIK